MQVVRCARGESGEAEIRGGRRTGRSSGRSGRWLSSSTRRRRPPSCRWPPRSPAAERLEAARDALDALGISTELDYERDRAASPRGGE